MKTRFALMLMASSLALGSAAAAEGVHLMDGVEPRPGDADMVAAGAFQKDSPWRIGKSHFGVNANTWTVQMAHEANHAAAQDPRIAEFILLDANISQTKQVADIEDLIAQGVDALIVTPLTPTSADEGIRKAVEAGIPVIVHTGLTQTQDYTMDIQGGGFNFGFVGGEWLAERLGGEGRIWALRGLPAHPEDINRYEGMRAALEGTNIEIVAEDHGSWQYDLGKNICETFFLQNPNVDGIWSSGADMSRACVDVFEQFGATPPPITGEGLNGFFMVWEDKGLDSIASEYSPEQGAAGVRAAVALLEGHEMHKRYIYEPPGITLERAMEFTRRDLSDNVWWPTGLPEEMLLDLYAN